VEVDSKVPDSGDSLDRCVANSNRNSQ